MITGCDIGFGVGGVAAFEPYEGRAQRQSIVPKSPLPRLQTINSCKLSLCGDWGFAPQY